MVEWERFEIARYLSENYIQPSDSKCVLGAKAQGFQGKALEAKVSTLLIKGWRKDMHIDGTIKHV